MTKITDEEMEEIRARVDKATKPSVLDYFDVQNARTKLLFEDIPKLLSEVERLRSDMSIANSRLRNMPVTPLGSLLSTKYVRVKYDDLIEIQRLLEAKLHDPN